MSDHRTMHLWRWPLRALLEACTLDAGRDPNRWDQYNPRDERRGLLSTVELAHRLDLHPDRVARAAKRGCTDIEADHWALRAGWHPAHIWGWDQWTTAGLDPHRAADLLPPARKVAAALQAEGRAVTHHAVTTRLRDHGVRMSNARAKGPVGPAPGRAHRPGRGRRGGSVTPATDQPCQPPPTGSASGGCDPRSPHHWGGSGIGTVAVARLLGVPYRTIYRYAAVWYPGNGHGHYIKLSALDVLVCQAFTVINTRVAPTAAARLRDLAETAIRAEPHRWLVLSTQHATTHPTIADAARTVAATRVRHRWVIDLRPPRAGGDPALASAVEQGADQ